MYKLNFDGMFKHTRHFIGNDMVYVDNLSASKRFQERTLTV